MSAGVNAEAKAALTGRVVLDVELETYDGFVWFDDGSSLEARVRQDETIAWHLVARPPDPTLESEHDGGDPCVHLLNLRSLLRATGMSVWSEHEEDPYGWVNVHCTRCARVYETVLREDPDQDDDE